MKRVFFTALMLVGISLSASAQQDDLYFVPKKKAKTESAQTSVTETKEASATSANDKTLSVTNVASTGLNIDEDTYNRRGSYLTEQGDAVSEFAMSDEGFVLITEEGDTMWLNTDTLRLTRVTEDENWVNGFKGSDSDYEYAMRLIRFRNPRYTVPVSSSLYWDVVHGAALCPGIRHWNVYDDGYYAYIFPTPDNYYYWDYMSGYPYGGHWWPMDGWLMYGGVWYDPWFNPHFPGSYYGFGGYHVGWLPGWHHGPYPGGHPGWGGGGKLSIRNDRHNDMASSHRGAQDNGGVGRTSTSASSSRQGSNVTRGDGGATRSTSVRVVTGRSGVSADRVSRSAGSNDEIVRRSSGSPSVNRSTASAGGSTRDSYTRQSSSRSNNAGMGSSYNRPSSTRSTSSPSVVSRGTSGSSSSYSSSRSGGGSSSSSRSSYSGSSSSYSGRSSFSSSSSSYSGGGGSYSSGSRGGGSSSGGSRSGGSVSGSRR